jgi:predicted RNA-binding Zn-ribbon protein involved in translation (DUF1610 family)
MGGGTLRADAASRPVYGAGEFSPGAIFFGMDILFSRFQNVCMEQIAKAIRCPKCGSLMRVRLAPAGKVPRSLRCEECERPDPLTTGEFIGWFKGELRPPK